MKIHDDLYGVFEIKEKVILELINSPAIQRLKNIDQAGYSKPFYKHTRNRYDHSIGVFLLLRKYGASIEEQIAGLIHDISHYAFSHAIDYILKEGNIALQDLQDRSKERFLMESNIPEILKKYGYDTEHVANENNFHLLENSLPDICADRLDYSLKDIVLLLGHSIEDTKKMMDHLKVKNKEIWYFDDPDVAYQYAMYFKQLNDDYYSGFTSAIMFKSIKDFIKHALEKGYIEDKDLEKYDQYVLDKCLQYADKDEILKKYWERMNDSKRFYESKDDYVEVISCKCRTVDPFCLVNMELKKVSEVFPDWSKTMKECVPVRQSFVCTRD